MKEIQKLWANKTVKIIVIAVVVYFAYTYLKNNEYLGFNKKGILHN